MASEQWGIWHDPVAEQQLDDYDRRGFQLVTPEQQREKPSQQLGQTAIACNYLLAKMYGPHYPIDTNMQAAIEAGTTDLYTLEDPDSQLAAMAALVHTQNPLDGDVRFAEIGRAVKDCDVMSLSDRPEDRLSAQGILRVRAMRAMGSPDIDILFSTTRTATHRPNMPGGYGVQRTWWGASAKNSEVQIPLITTAVGFDYRIGRTQPQPEPFNGFMIPTDPERWAAAVNESTIYVPPGMSKSIIETLFADATKAAVLPTIRIADKKVDVTTKTFTTLQPATTLTGGKYVLTDQSPEAEQISFEEIEADLDEGAFSQKIVIETDIASTKQGAGILIDLYERGWQLAGWQPSYTTYGGVCPVVTRMHPATHKTFIPPAMAPENFAQLAKTREVLDHIYGTIHASHLTQKGRV